MKMKSKILILLVSIGLLFSMNANAQFQSDDDPCIKKSTKNFYLGETYTFSSNFGQCDDCYYWTVVGGAVLISDPTSNVIEVEIVSTGPFTICNTFFDAGECASCCETFAAYLPPPPPPDCCVPEVRGYHNCLTNSSCHGGGVFEMFFDECRSDQFDFVQLFLPPTITDKPNVWDVTPQSDQITISLSGSSIPQLSVPFCSNHCKGTIEVVAIFYYEDEECEPLEIRHEIEAGCPCDEFTEERLSNPTVFPNPIQTSLNFKTTFNRIEKEVIITLSDLNSGTIISSKKYDTVEAGQFSESFEIANQNNNGIYILTVESNNEILHTEVIQQTKY